MLLGLPEEGKGLEGFFLVFFFFIVKIIVPNSEVFETR